MKYFVLIILLYLAGFINYLGSTMLLTLFHYVLLGVSICSFFQYIFVHKCNKIAILAILFCFAYPIYAGFKSQFLFGQPVYMGIGSLRYVDFFLLGYFLLLVKYDYRTLLSQVNGINLCVAIFSIVLILILGVNPNTITAHEVTNNVVGGNGTVYDDSYLDSEHNVRGIRFAAWSGFLVVSLVYYQLASLKYGGKKNWIIFGILVFYLLFVHKGRQPVGVMGLIYIVYYFRMKRFTTKKLMMIIAPVLVLIVIMAYDSSFLLRFSTVFDGEDSKDFSTLARLKSIDAVIPLIKENMFLGLGNLSAQWGSGGFQTFFGSTFFLSDIGIIGAMATGGLLLICIYIGIYVCLWKKTKYVNDKNIAEFFRYMIFADICFTVLFFNDSLCGDKTAKFSLLFFPLFSVGNPNLYIHESARIKRRIFVLPSR